MKTKLTLLALCLIAPLFAQPPLPSTVPPPTIGTAPVLTPAALALYRLAAEFDKAWREDDTNIGLASEADNFALFVYYVGRRDANYAAFKMTRDAAIKAQGVCAGAETKGELPIASNEDHP